MKVAINKEFAKQIKAAIRKQKNNCSVSLWFYKKDNRIIVNIRNYLNGTEISLVQDGGVTGISDYDIVLPMSSNDMVVDMLLKETCLLMPYNNNRPNLIITNDDGIRYQEECIIVKSMKTGKEIKITDFVTCSGAGKYGMLKYEREA